MSLTIRNFSILSIAIFFTSYAFANNINFNEIVIPKNFKTDRTFSGDLSDTDSFHLIFGKNRKTKSYTVLAYFFDGKETLELPSLTNEKPYNVLSYHYKNNILSLLLTYNVNKKKTFLKRINYNLKENILEESDVLDHTNIENVIRVKDRSILLYKEGEVLFVKEFIGNYPIIIKTLKVDKVSSFSDYFKDKYVAIIKNNEFVKNGSLSKLKLYYNNHSLIFTKDTDLFRNTEFIKLNLSKDSLSIEKKTFDNETEGNFQKMASFFSDDKLYQFIQTKEKSFINFFDTNTGQKLSTFFLDESLNGYVKNNSNFQGISNFLKHSKKTNYIVTITANKTINNKIRIRLDYVDIDYSYQNNFLQFNQMNQGVMRQNLPTGFGPKINDDFVFNNAVVEKEKRFFELIIDKKGTLLNEKLPETIYKEIDKKKEVDHLKGISHFKYQSSCFLKNSFRYMAYDKSTKSFIINTI